MPISHSLLTTATVDNIGGSGIATTPSFTPASGALIVVAVGCEIPGAADTPGVTISDSIGLTWTRHVFQENNNFYSSTASFFTAVGTGASMTVTLNNNRPGWNGGGFAIGVVEVTGHDTIVQAPSNGNDSGWLTDWPLTLTSNPASSSLVLAIFQSERGDSPAASDVGPGSGWTEEAEFVADTGNGGFVASLISRTGSTSDSVLWTPGNASASLSAAAIEISAAAGGSEGTSAGTSTAEGVSAPIADAAASSSATSLSEAVSEAIADADGLSSGASVNEAVGDSDLAATDADGLSDGLANVEAAGAAIADADGLSGGSANVEAVGGSDVESSEVVIFLTSGSSWEVPADWNNSDNTIECIGGGAGGSGNAASTDGGLGGGGGAYARVSNLVLTLGASIAYGVGGGGGGGSGAAGADGGDTWFNGTDLDNCSVGAEGGTGGGLPSEVFPRGGRADNSTGDVTTSGGGAGAGIGSSEGGTGGGGAAGPNGVGGAGGNQLNAGLSGSGGGGADGGSSGGIQAGGDTAGGEGGDNRLGAGGGTGGTGSPGNGGAGSDGGGGGGGRRSLDGGDGGTGSAEALWTQTSDDATAGPGGGGGGSGAASSGGNPSGNGGHAANYGGGGGGVAYDSSGLGIGGNGAQGIIVITYTPTDADPADGLSSSVADVEGVSASIADVAALSSGLASADAEWEGIITTGDALSTGAASADGVGEGASEVDGLSPGASDGEAVSEVTHEASALSASVGGQTEAEGAATQSAAGLSTGSANAEVASFVEEPVIPPGPAEYTTGTGAGGGAAFRPEATRYKVKKRKPKTHLIKIGEWPEEPKPRPQPKLPDGPDADQFLSDDGDEHDDEEEALIMALSMIA